GPLPVEGRGRTFGQFMAPTLTRKTSDLYVADWLRTFAMRIRVSALVAHLAMSRTATLTLLPLFRACPLLLTFGANLSGKSTLRQDKARLHPKRTGVCCPKPAKASE